MHWHDKSAKTQGFARQQVQGILARRPGLTILGLALLSTLGIGNNVLTVRRSRESPGQRGGNALPASLVGVIREATRRYLHADAARTARPNLV